MASAALIVDLRQVEKRDLALAGGKGANLGELVRAGFPVPSGFVVTTAAYDRLVSENQLEETIAPALRNGSDAAAALRAVFLEAPIPVGVEHEIRSAYDRLGTPPVAVRSSATAEDLPEAAFAGQQDTFLNVIGTAALLDAVRRCWASLWTERAIVYRERQHIDQRAVKLAVVVQRMVPADVAGVLFTANPVTGARHEMVVNASPGLGESVVAGIVTPDQYILRRQWWGWQIVERQLGRREVVVRPRAGGGTEHITPDPRTSALRPVLTDRELRRLTRLGTAIERHLGQPQDIEWAGVGSRSPREFVILQARPITALPEPAPRAGPLTRAIAGIVAEMLPVRPYPLEATTWGPGLVISALLGPLLRTVGLDLRADQLFVEEDGVIVRFTGRLPARPTPLIFLAPLRLLRLARRYDVARWQADPLLDEALARAKTLERRDPRALSWTDLLATVNEALAIPFLLGELRVRYMAGAIIGVASLRLMLGLLGRADRFDTLLSGIETKTLEANRALAALAARIQSDPSVADVFQHLEPSQLLAVLEAQPSGRAFLEELRAFLERYGHREAGGTLLVSQSTWKDTPAVVLGILKGLALAPAPAQTHAPDWQTVRDQTLAHPILRLPPPRSAFLALLTHARYFTQLREDTRFYATMVLPILYRTLVECGRRLVKVGVLDAPEDVFHLKLEELERVDGVWPPQPDLATELRVHAQQRKQRRVELEGTPLVDPRLIRRAQPEGDVLVHGMPGSPGVAEGPVRVVHDASEFGKLQPGDVLVAPYTNPAWTPLFQRAAAVVVDSGGAMSHAAIVAREYGIPAVMATTDGTRRLTDGQRVRVEGSQGVVIPIT